MSSAESEDQSTEQAGRSNIPEFRTEQQDRRLSILKRLRQFLSEMPEDTPCLCCGNTTVNLVQPSLRHDAFQCTVSISVCSTCSQKPPFVLKGRDDRKAWTIVLAVTGTAFLFLYLWLPGALVLVAALVAALFMKSPKRISTAERNLKLRELLTKVPHIEALLKTEQNLTIRVPLRDASISRLIAEPHRILDQSLVFLEEFQFCCDYADLHYSRVSEVLLVQFIKRIMELTTQAIQDSELNEETALQVDCAILPGRRTMFEFQVITKNSDRLRKQLMPQLQELPAVPVCLPLIFCLRRCKERGMNHMKQLSPPFITWKNRMGWTSGGSYAEKAMHIFEISPAEDSAHLTPEDCAAWRRQGQVSDSLALLHVDLLMAENKADEALAVFEEQIRISSESPELRLRFATLLEHIEQKERAAAVCQKLVSDFPEFTAPYGFLAHLQLELGRPADARQTLIAAPKKNRSARFWLTWARVEWQLDQSGTALGHLSVAMLKDATLPQPYLLRGQILAADGKFPQALDDIRRFQELAGPTITSTQLKVAIYRRMQQLDLAVNSISEALQQFPSHPQFLLMRADTLTDAGKLELARSDCDSILLQHPQITMALEMRARIHIENSDAESAFADADKGINSGHSTCQIYMYRGISNLMGDDHEAALEDLNFAVGIDSDNIYARYHLSRVKAILGQTEDAISELTTVLMSNDEWTQARIARAFLLLNSGETKRAAEDFDRVIRDAPTNPDAYRGRSLVHELAGEKRQALLMLDKALVLDPENASCRMNRSRLLMEDHDLKAARKDLDSVLSSIPDLLPALLSRAQVRLQMGDFDDAQKDFEAILKDHPEFTPALIGRSVIWDQKGETDRSMEDLDAATRVSPENAEAIEISRLLMKTSLAHESEHFEESIRTASEIIEIDPDNYTAYRYRAGSYWYAELFVEALQDYTYLIETLEEPDAGSFNGRGQVYAELGDYELAMQDLQQAIRIARLKNESALPFSLSGMGKTLTGLGRLDEADAAFRESLSLHPDNAWLHFNRGLMYLARDDRQSAGLCFELSLRLTNPRLSPRKRAKAEGFVASLKTL